MNLIYCTHKKCLFSTIHNCLCVCVSMLQKERERDQNKTDPVLLIFFISLSPSANWTHHQICMSSLHLIARCIPNSTTSSNELSSARRHDSLIPLIPYWWLMNSIAIWLMFNMTIWKMVMFHTASGKIQVALRIEWLGLLPERYNPDDKTRDVSDICSALYIIAK